MTLPTLSIGDHSFLSCVQVDGDSPNFGKYVAEASGFFDDLSHAVRQLAGILLVRQLKGSPSFTEPALFQAASTTLVHVSKRIKLLRPSTPSEHHHYRHMCAAAAALTAAVGSCERELFKEDAAGRAVNLLTSAWQEMVFASHAIEGFTVVDVSQSCCSTCGFVKLNGKSIR